MDSELDRVRVLEFIYEHVVKVRYNRCLALLEAALDGGEVENVLLVEVAFPPLLQRDQVICEPVRPGDRLDAVESPGRAAARQPGLGLLTEQVPAEN